MPEALFSMHGSGDSAAPPRGAVTLVARARRPRRAMFAVSLLVVALLHAALLNGLEVDPRIDRSRRQGPPTLWVHTITPESGEPPEAHAIARAILSPPATAVIKPAAPGAIKARTSHSSAGRPRSASGTDPIGAALASEAAPTTELVKPRTGQEGFAPSAAVEPAAATPLHATIIPPPTRISYRMRRGAVQGSADFAWQPEGERYEARLVVRVDGAMLRAQVSRGDLDATGLAPQRFTDQRARRGTQAISFQRDAGTISFSSVTNEIALGSGLQDRLSWLIQLVAIAAAEPQRLVPQGKITISVVGPRGDYSVWQFVCVGEEGVAAESANARVIRLRREPQAAYDTDIDLWLDAQPPHWPVRAHWRNGPQDPGLELWRADLAGSR